MRTASGQADGVIAARASTDVFSRLSPLFECDTEADGWERCANIARELFGADNVGAVEFVSVDSVVVRAVSGAQLSPKGSTIRVVNRSGPVGGAAIGQVIISNDLDAEARFTPHQVLIDGGVRSCALLSLQLADGHVVVIGVHSYELDHFTEDDGASLKVLGEVFTHALNRLRAPSLGAANAQVDALTGIMNRTASLEAYDTLLNAGRTPAALVVNLDGFKGVNVDLGQRSGDTVLQTVAQRIESAIGPDDTVGRLSGDEFLVLAANGDGELLAERLITHIEATIELGSRTTQISAAIGIGRPRQGDDALAVVERADRLMRQAKHSGRGEIRCDVEVAPLAGPTAPSGDQSIPADHILDAAIAGLRVVVQPIVDPRTGHIHGVETLARGPVGHLLEYPDRLFQAARTLDRLGELELAAKQLAFSLELPVGMRLYVNLEPSLLCDPEWMALLHGAWRDGYQHTLVTAEVTERDVMRAPGHLLRAVEVSRQLGWKIALDDVGSRSESLAALRWIDPDVVKLDMSLITNDNPAHTAHVVAAVTAYRDMDRHGDVTVIAEGVETAADAQHADVLGADLLQGYLFGRPGPIDELDFQDSVAPRGVAPTPLVDGERVTTKRELIAMTRHVESTVITPDTILVATVQEAKNVSAATQHQYQDLARRCGFIGMIGVDVSTQWDDELAGVRTVDLDPDDPMTRNWRVVAMSPTASLGLLATEVGAPSDDLDDLDRLFRYRFITDAGEVEAAVRDLLRYF